MKGTRKSRHTRTSKRGRKFLAGRGIRRAHENLDDIQNKTFIVIRDKDKPKEELTQSRKDFERTMKVLRA